MQCNNVAGKPRTQPDDEFMPRSLEEDKLFETLLAEYWHDHDRCSKIAAKLSGKDAGGQHAP